ncbi:MAG: universal stress protein [Treponema sp.]|jgi:nucleotide-binding universal stress UspA family protein|nr:universal stress protein [Treponema sp.]
MIRPLFQNVLVAVNGSESSIHAAMYGIMMTKLYHLHLKIVYVVDTATLKQLTLGKFFITEESAEYEKSLLADGEKYLQYITELADSKGVKIETEMREGAIWSEIIIAAEESKAELILLGGRETDANFGTLVRHNVVSAARSEIIGSAHCSVLVVNEPKIEQLFKIA